MLSTISGIFQDLNVFVYVIYMLQTNNDKTFDLL